MYLNFRDKVVFDYHVQNIEVKNLTRLTHLVEAQLF